MSQENVKLVRSIFAAWERGDFSSAEWAHPDIEYVIADGPSPGTWSGLAGMAEAWRDFLSAWDEARARWEDCRALDDERVLVFFRRSGRGKTSGLEMEQIQSKGANLFHVRGKVIEARSRGLLRPRGANTHSVRYTAQRQIPYLKRNWLSNSGGGGIRTLEGPNGP
jgi:ketosteroid isomerase-like protein